LSIGDGVSKPEIVDTQKKYIEFIPLSEDEPEYLKIRGYKASTLEIPKFD
jgi:hypothetical protein